MTVVTPDLNTRRKLLKMQVEVLVKRSGVPRPTVFRILRGKWEPSLIEYLQNSVEYQQMVNRHRRHSPQTQPEPWVIRMEIQTKVLY